MSDNMDWETTDLPDADALAAEEDFLQDNEIQSDPIFLYLREIGQTALLTADQEFWLAVMIAAQKRLTWLQTHPKAHTSGEFTPQRLFSALYAETRTAWQRAQEDIERWGCEPPDLTLIVAEGQMLHHTWETDTPSYTRAYLNNGSWGKDPFWDGIASHLVAVLIGSYALPEITAQRLVDF